MLAWPGDVAQFPDRAGSSSVRSDVAQGSQGSRQLHTAQCRGEHHLPDTCLHYSWKAEALKQTESSMEDSEKL